MGRLTRFDSCNSDSQTHDGGPEAKGSARGRVQATWMWVLRLTLLGRGPKEVLRGQSLNPNLGFFFSFALWFRHRLLGWKERFKILKVQA